MKLKKVILPCGQIYLNVYIFRIDMEFRSGFYIGINFKFKTRFNLLCAYLQYRFNDTFQWFLFKAACSVQIKNIFIFVNEFLSLCFQNGFYSNCFKQLLLFQLLRRYSSKQVFLKISYYPQENTCVGVLKAKDL